MPNIFVRLPEGVFDTEAKQNLATAITSAVKQIEQIGDDPRQEFLTWVVFDEIKSGHFFAGGLDPLGQAVPVIIFFHPPAGVLDEAGRANAVAAMHAAVKSALPAGDSRAVMTSVLVSEVPDGTWGANGALWRLPDFTRAAGYKHLQHLVAG